jgi:hypothetical protein
MPARGRGAAAPGRGGGGQFDGLPASAEVADGGAGTLPAVRGLPHSRIFSRDLVRAVVLGVKKRPPPATTGWRRPSHRGSYVVPPNGGAGTLVPCATCVTAGSSPRSARTMVSRWASKEASKEKGAGAPLSDLIEVHQNHLSQRRAVAQPGSTAQDAVLQCAVSVCRSGEVARIGPLLRSPQPNEETS